MSVSLEGTKVSFDLTSEPIRRAMTHFLGMFFAWGNSPTPETTRAIAEIRLCIYEQASEEELMQLWPYDLATLKREGMYPLRAYLIQQAREALDEG